MSPLDERALWLSRNVLPHEPALRVWLQQRRVAGLEVDDVIQETYARLSTVDRVDHIRDAKAYTFQIAHSLMVTFVRRSRIVSVQSIERLESLGIAFDAPDAEAHVSGRDELHHLAEAIAALPGKIRDVFVLRRVEGLSQRDVAQRLGLAESTVEKHMSKAFQTLSVTFSRSGKLHHKTSRDGGVNTRRIHGIHEASGD